MARMNDGPLLFHPITLIMMAVIVVNLLVIGLRVIAFTHVVRWHNNGHPVTVIINGEKMLATKSDSLGYYVVDYGKLKLYISPDEIGPEQSCDVCRGPGGNPWFIRLAWNFFGIDKDNNIKGNDPDQNPDQENPLPDNVIPENSVLFSLL